MNKAEVAKLRNNLNKVLEEFNKTSDIKMELGNASFGDTVTFKLVGNTVNSKGEVNTKELLDFTTYQHRHGLTTSALNYEFNHHGKTIKITGYKTRSPKYSIQYTMNGSGYKCGVEYMKQIIKESAPELLFCN